jgi:hypothetical protein
MTDFGFLYETETQMRLKPGHIKHSVCLYSHKESKHGIGPIEISTDYKQYTHIVGPSSKASDLHSGGAQVKSRLRPQVSCLRVFVVFLSLQVKW